MSKIFGDDYFLNETHASARASARTAVRDIHASGSNLVDSVLSGSAWGVSTLTYAFPKSPYNYSYGGEPYHNFGAVGSAIIDAAKFALDISHGSKADNGFSVEGFTNLNIVQGSNASTAIVRYANSSGDGVNYTNDTAVGYLPQSSSEGGDVWFSPTGGYGNARQGNYEFVTVLHETGHALGLKHGHESDYSDTISATLKGKYDSLEYSVMTYHGFPGAGLSGYTNEDYGYPQTYMMADIAALQYMYGADYTTNSSSTTYSWKPSSGRTYVNGSAALQPGANRIFATIWDGGGAHDKYDLSAYTNDLKIDLRPGRYSVFKTSQLAELDYNSGKDATGNIYNALLYKGNKASLIEDATGGSGDDRLLGNVGNNILRGHSGNDTFFGFQGNDTLYGGSGKDVFYFAKGYDRDRIADFASGDKISLTSFDLDNLADVKSHGHNSGNNVVLDFGGGDVLTIAGMELSDLKTSYFTL